jgi:hypothetical protein
VSVGTSVPCSIFDLARSCTEWTTYHVLRPQTITGTNGINCSQATCTYSLPAGTQVTLVALYPSSATWSGASHSTPFTLTGDKTVTVN